MSKAEIRAAEYLDGSKTPPVHLKTLVEEYRALEMALDAPVHAPQVDERMNELHDRVVMFTDLLVN
jgi:hypothetical protein